MEHLSINFSNGQPDWRYIEMGLDWDGDGFIFSFSFSFSFSLYHPLLYFYYTSVGHNVVRAGIYWGAKSPISTSYKSRWLEDIRDGPPDWSGDSQPISNHGRIFHCTICTHTLSLLLPHVSATSLNFTFASFLDF